MLSYFQTCLAMGFKGTLKVWPFARLIKVFRGDNLHLAVVSPSVGATDLVT